VSLAQIPVLSSHQYQLRGGRLTLSHMFFALPSSRTFLRVPTSDINVNRCTSNGICDVVVRAGSMVDAILSAASGSMLKTTKLDQTQMI
jgi:hypothetical protein